MKTPARIMLALLSAWLALPLTSFGDTLTLKNGSFIQGTTLQTNGDDVAVLTPYAVYNFSKANIAGIKKESSAPARSGGTNRLSDFQNALLILSRQSWATNLTAIPATVVDKGILKNVPYLSFRAGADYEVNIYGDLDHPASIEIGIYRSLLDSLSARKNCIGFIQNLLRRPADQTIVQGLGLEKDLKTNDEFTFEVTPSTDEDAYGGWWISVYSEKALNLARASDEELKQLSVTKVEATKAANQNDNLASWSLDELKLARRTPPTTITFTNKAGVLISNAEVVRVIDGVSLIWKSGSPGSVGGGMVKLADLPEDLQRQFGYDASKTAKAAVLDAKRLAQGNAYSLPPPQGNRVTDTPATQDFSQSSIPDLPSSGGRVFVRGYTRANGTYVDSYTRSAPHRR